MRRGLFVALSLAVVPAIAQQSGANKEQTHSIQERNKVDQANFVPYISKKSAVSVNLGRASNAYSTAFGPKTYLWVDPSMDVITFSHRNDANTHANTTSGHLRYDVSFDGGGNWSTDQGPVWGPAQIPAVNGTLNGPARYPQSVLFNPTGNTNPDSAYLAFFAPTLNGTNNPGSWGGLLMGSVQLSGNHLDTMEISTNTTTGLYWQVPDDFTYVPDSQKVYGLNQRDDVTTGTVSYTDSVTVSIGTFDAAARKFNYTHTNVHFPFETDTAGTAGNTVFADAKIAFSPDGTVGYISGVGYLNDPLVGPYGAYTPVIIKTTDGGKTWGAQKGVNLDNLTIAHHGTKVIDSISTLYPTWTINALTTAFEHDLVVDKNGNPHIFTNLCPSSNNSIPPGGTSGAAFSVYSALSMMTDVYSTDGGTTWEAHVVDTNSTFRGNYGPDPASPLIAEDNRPQMARTSDGATIIYAFGDTDVAAFGTTENFYPDVHVRGLDVSSNQMGNIGNLTNNLQDKGSANFFNLPHIIKDANGAGEFELPVTATALSNDDRALVDQAVQYIYLDLLYSFTVGISEHDVVTGEISALYPNPASDLVNLAYTVKVPGEYEVAITTISGVTVKTMELGNIGSGNHRENIDISNLTAGVYLVTLSTGENATSKKLIIQ